MNYFRIFPTSILIFCFSHISESQEKLELQNLRHLAQKLNISADIFTNVSKVWHNYLQMSVAVSVVKYRQKELFVSYIGCLYLASFSVTQWLDKEIMHLEKYIPLAEWGNKMITKSDEQFESNQFVFWQQKNRPDSILNQLAQLSNKSGDIPVMFTKKLLSHPQNNNISEACSNLTAWTVIVYNVMAPLGTIVFGNAYPVQYHGAEYQIGSGQINILASMSLLSGCSFLITKQLSDSF